MVHEQFLSKGERAANQGETYKSIHIYVVGKGAHIVEGGGIHNRSNNTGLTPEIATTIQV